MGRCPLPVFLLLIPALLCFCVKGPAVKGPETLRLIQNVPFYPQEAFQCGPASLAGVLNYWGLPVSPEVIAVKLYSPQPRGP
jgi:hypothetical protein